MIRQNSEQGQVGAGYAAYQLARALTTSADHADGETRARARARVDKWVAVFNGILSGSIDVGSRTPLSGIPEWVTLEVVTGGFSTGGLLAGGAMQAHEPALAARLGIDTADGNRQPLNSYYLSERGLSELQELVKSGCYRVNVPEESALLFVAWLVGSGHVDAARQVLDEIAPFFSRLRFYPVPAETPSVSGSSVYLQTVRETVASLCRIRSREQIMSQKEAVLIWLPLYDKLVELFFETVDGAPPLLIRKAEQTSITGGWPCELYPDGWESRAKALLDEYAVARLNHGLCRRPEKKKESFAQLHQHLRTLLSNPNALTPRDRGRIRLILARYHAKHGLPGSAKCRAEREVQAAQVDRPTFPEIAAAVARRLEALPQDGGIDEVVETTAVISADEAAEYRLPQGWHIPESIALKVQRSQKDDIEALTAKGIITSADTLARVLPQITATLRSAGISDPDLRRLYSLNYQAFSKRRSLLLLNLESQVKLEELPWVNAIEPLRSPNLEDRELARQALVEVTLLTFRHFPHAIVPNKLLQEMRTMLKVAGLDIPLVDEVAADIFMGRFSEKYVIAARSACSFLADSLYTRYYGIDNQEVQALASKERKQLFFLRVKKATENELARYCAERADVQLGTWDPATNGMIIEQQQILTTQNLAALYEGLELASQVAPWLEEMVRDIFGWIVKRLQVKTSNHHARLIAVKNCAYAWRQMIFFLSQMAPAHASNSIAWCAKHLSEQPEHFKLLFGPALNGLELAARGSTLDAAATERAGGMRFLGWSKKQHWLLAAGGQRI